MSEGSDRGSQSFPTTEWSLVQRAGVGGTDSQEALEVLLRRYLPALRSHLVMRRRMEADVADDMLQGFTLDKVIQSQLIAKASAARGRFRTFLLTSLDRYVIDRIRFSQARKRSGGKPDVDVDDLAETQSTEEPPDRAFNLAWAREILAEARRRMQDECLRTSRNDMWDVFETRVWLPTMENAEAVDYQTLVERHRFRSPAEASSVMIAGKRLFARYLRAVVGEYSPSAAEIDAEIRDLYEIVAGR